MASILNDQIKDEDLKVGDPVELNFDKVLNRALERQLYYNYKTAGGDVIKTRIPIEESLQAMAMYGDIKDKINRLFVDVPGSPLDLIRDRLQAQGYKVGELTGRSFIIDYTDENNPVLGMREETNKQTIMRQFNGGELDVLIANRSASTGVSLHAGKEFKDKKPRIMMMVQPELDINEVVQMFGRIFRTGQVELPEYRLLFSALPSEKRPAAILTQKMASLNANVSGSQKGATNLDIPNFMNEYGDELMREMILELSPSEQLQLLGKSADKKTDLEGLTARRATGWMSIAPVDMQEQFMEEYLARYQEKIDDLTAKGENKLIIQEFDYQAETINKVTVFKGTDNENPLTADAYMEDVEINVLTRPLTREDVQERIDSKEKKYINKKLVELKELADKYYGDKINKIKQQIKKIEPELEKARSSNNFKKEEALNNTIFSLNEKIVELENEHNYRETEILYFLNSLEVGNSGYLKETTLKGHTKHDRIYNAVLIDFVIKKASGSPMAFSNLVLRFATNDRKRHFIAVPLSQLMDIVGVENGGYAFTSSMEPGLPESWESTLASSDREVVPVLTNNLFAAYLNDGLAGPRDSIIRFTTKDGKIRSGIVLTDKKANEDKVTTNNAMDVMKYLKTQRPYIRPVNALEVYLTYNEGRFQITVPQTTKDGEKYYANRALLNIVENGEFTQTNYVDVKTGKKIKGFIATVKIGKESLFGLALNQFGFEFQLPASFFTEQENPPASAYGYADTGGYKYENTSILEMPEIYDFITAINDGKAPKVVENIRSKKGTVLGRFYPGSGVVLRADIFSDPELAKRVISHELGHFIDWLPTKTMSRGNILGRMFSLKNYMAGDYKNLYRNSEVREELKRLTRIWKPFDPAKNEKYTKYRYSSAELYADAVSVLFNNPDLLKEVAPKFYKGFFEGIERKPKVKKLWDNIQEKINRGWHEIEEDRYQKRRQSFERTEEKMLGIEDELSHIKNGLWDELGRLFVDKNWKIIKMRRMALKRQIAIDPENDPVYWLEELPYVSSELFQYLRDTNNEIKAKLEDYGLTEADLGDYLFLNRAATERAALANPWGYDPKAANEGLDYLKHKLGADKYEKLESLINRFKQIRRRAITDLMIDSEMYSDELVKIIEDNENYATFSVEEYLDKNYGNIPTGHIYKQIGTLKAIKNPFIATILKDAAIIRAANRKMAAEKVVDFIESYYPEEIKPADKKWVNNHYEFIQPKDKDKDLIVFMHKGKMQGFVVDKYIAKSFQNDPFEANLLIKIHDLLYAGLKNVLVSKNPFWAIWNAQRDWRSSALKLPKANMIKVLYWAVKSIPDAYQDVFLGQSTDIVREMYENKSLIVGRYWRSKVSDEYTEYERMLEHYTIHPRSHRSIVHKVGSAFLDALEYPGRFSERLFKIAGAKYLKNMGMTGKQASHYVRAMAGSPDFYRRAQWTRAVNNVFMFSNAGKEGWRSNFEGFTDSKAAYTWKLIKYSLVPKLLMWGGTIGVVTSEIYKAFGWDDDEIKEMFNNIPDHDMQNYQCVPIGMTENGKTVYLRFPDDFFGQVFGGILWRMLKPYSAGSLAEMLDYVHGQIPYSSLNPLIQAAINAGAMVTGRNIYDPWSGDTVIPDRQFKAGGYYKWSYYAKYQVEQLGVSNYYRFPKDNVEEVKTELEKWLDKPVVGGLLKRFIKISNRGKFEKLEAAGREIEQQKAIANLELEKVVNKHLNSIKEPTRDDARKLYVKLKKEGYEVGTFGQKFYPKYMVSSLFKENDAVVKAFTYASTNDEKARILEEAYPGVKVDAAYVRKFKRELKKMFYK